MPLRGERRACRADEERHDGDGVRRDRQIDDALRDPDRDVPVQVPRDDAVDGLPARLEQLAEDDATTVGRVGALGPPRDGHGRDREGVERRVERRVVARRDRLEQCGGREHGPVRRPTGARAHAGRAVRYRRAEERLVDGPGGGDARGRDDERRREALAKAAEEPPRRFGGRRRLDDLRAPELRVVEERERLDVVFRRQDHDDRRRPLAARSREARRRKRQRGARDEREAAEASARVEAGRSERPHDRSRRGHHGQVVSERCR